MGTERRVFTEINTENKKYYLLDLDGTVSDSARGIARSVSVALEHFGIKVNDLKKLECFVGPPLRDSFARYYGLNPAECEEALAVYREYYAKEGLYECFLYPGVLEFLKAVSEKGRHSVLATAKPEPFAQEVIRHLGISEYFDGVAGADFAGKLDNKADVIANAIRLCVESADKSELIMIGDRNYDIKAAKANGLESAGVINGSDKREELLAAGANLIVADFFELAEFLL